MRHAAQHYLYQIRAHLRVALVAQGLAGFGQVQRLRFGPFGIRYRLLHKGD